MDSRKYYTVFLGTPDFAVPTLRAMLEDSRFVVSCVVTQPDRPAGRGQKLLAPPIKDLAVEYGIPVFQPISLKSIEVDDAASRFGRLVLIGEKSAKPFVDYLNSPTHNFDIFVTAAYGNIIPTALLHYCAAPMVNIHPSLLPRWRGAAPLQQSIFSGDKETGVCLMQVEEGLDTGPVFCEERIEIDSNDTLGVLHDRLAEIGQKLLIANLENIILGDLKPRIQDESLATYAHKWEKEDALINWGEHAQVTERRIRASNPIPGARTSLRGEMLKIYSAKEVLDIASSYASELPGTVVEVNNDRFVIACGGGSFLAILELQMPGRKRLPTSEVLKGYRVTNGEFFA